MYDGLLDLSRPCGVASPQWVGEADTDGAAAFCDGADVDRGSVGAARAGGGQGGDTDRTHRPCPGEDGGGGYDYLVTIGNGLFPGTRKEVDVAVDEFFAEPGITPIPQQRGNKFLVVFVTTRIMDPQHQEPLLRYFEAE